MTIKIKNILAILALSFMILSCDILKSHNKYILENKDNICATVCTQPIDTEINTSSKDTIYTTTENETMYFDTISLTMLFTCDSMNKVILQHDELIKSKYSKILYELNNGKLVINILRDSLKIKNKVIHSVKTNTVIKTLKVPMYINKVINTTSIPWWVYVVFTLSFVFIFFLIIKNLIK